MRNRKVCVTSKAYQSMSDQGGQEARHPLAKSLGLRAGERILEHWCEYEGFILQRKCSLILTDQRVIRTVERLTDSSFRSRQDILLEDLTTMEALHPNPNPGLVLGGLFVFVCGILMAVGDGAPFCFGMSFFLGVALLVTGLNRRRHLIISDSHGEYNDGAPLLGRPWELTVAALLALIGFVIALSYYGGV